MSDVETVFNPTTHRPADFDAFWDAIARELDATPPAPELFELPIRSTEFATCYALRLTSIGPYRIFAYYSVPHGKGPFPALYHAPGYGSVVHVPPYEERRRHVVLSLCARGQRHADQPFAASYPGLLTHGIDDPSQYAYRGIAADAARAVDFLLSRPEVDARRIAVMGSDTALFAAALRPQVKALVVGDPMFFAANDLAPRTSAYPLEELNDYARTYAERAASMRRTLAYFDPHFLAPRIRATSLISHGHAGALFGPAQARCLAQAIGSSATLFERTGYGYRDRLDVEGWVAGALSDEL